MLALRKVDSISSSMMIGSRVGKAGEEGVSAGPILRRPLWLKSLQLSRRGDVSDRAVSRCAGSETVWLSCLDGWGGRAGGGVRRNDVGELGVENKSRSDEIVEVIHAMYQDRSPKTMAPGTGVNEALRMDEQVWRWKLMG